MKFRISILTLALTTLLYFMVIVGSSWILLGLSTGVFIYSQFKGFPRQDHKHFKPFWILVMAILVAWGSLFIFK
jgi:hypothetical protein